MAPQIRENRPFFAQNSAILQETELTSLNLKIDHDTALLGRDKQIIKVKDAFKKIN